MDKCKEERERGVTINCAIKSFNTDSKYYTIIDAPGHRDFVKNMITGTSQADVALLMVPADRGGFETAIAKGDRSTGTIQGQTRAHAHICKLLGVEQMIVGINKMDSADYSEERFNEIKNEVSKMLESIGYKADRIPFFPFSGYSGENLITPCDKMPWYKGFTVVNGPKSTVSGHTLVDALDRVPRLPKVDLNAPPMMPVSEILNIKGVGNIITGRTSGVFRKGDVVRFLPSGATGKCFSFEMHHEPYDNTEPGQNVGVNIKGLLKDTNMPKRGDVMLLDNPSRYKDALGKECFGTVESMKVAISVQDHPGQLKKGFCPSLAIRTAKAPGKMTEIHWKLGKKTTAGVKVDNPEFLEMGDMAEVTFEPQMPLYATSFEFDKAYGRVAVMDSNSLVMLGKVVSVTYKPFVAK
jgi:elongation factor 1-alpha